MRHVAKIISRQHFIIVTNDDKKNVTKNSNMQHFFIVTNNSKNCC